MAEEIAFENCRISNSEGLMTLTLNWVNLHTVVHHSLTSTYMPNFTEIEETFVDVHTYGFTNGRVRPALLGRLSRRVHLKTSNYVCCNCSFNSFLQIPRNSVIAITHLVMP